MNRVKDVHVNDGFIADQQLGRTFPKGYAPFEVTPYRSRDTSDGHSSRSHGQNESGQRYSPGH